MNENEEKIKKFENDKILASNGANHEHSRDWRAFYLFNVQNGIAQSVR